MLMNKFNDFAKEVLVKAAQLMSDKYTDNDKAGIGLSMALDAKDFGESYLLTIDEIQEKVKNLEEQNSKLLARNEELLKKFEEVQKDVAAYTVMTYDGIREINKRSQKGGNKES